jgi:hypothetical protein
VNLVETHDLLTLIAKYDNRRFDDATVIAWRELLADLPFDDCRTAALAHFGRSEKYIMPFNIIQGANDLDRERRRILREQREAAEQRALEARPTTDRSVELRAAIRDMLPPGDPDKLRRAEWVEADRRRERLANAEPNPLYDPTIAARAEESPT